MSIASPQSPRRTRRSAALAALAAVAVLGATPVAASAAVLSLGDAAAPVVGLVSPGATPASDTTTAPAPISVRAAGIRLDLGLDVALGDGPLLGVDLAVGATVPGVADVQADVGASVDPTPASILPSVTASTAVTVGAGPSAGSPGTPGPGAAPGTPGAGAPSAPARPRPSTPASGLRPGAASPAAPGAVAPVAAPAPARATPVRRAAPRRRATAPASPATSRPAGGRAAATAGRPSALAPVAGQPDTEVASSITSRPQPISAPRRVAAALTDAVRAASTSPWLPVAVLAAIAAYLLGQRALDRGSKLSYAGRAGDPDDELIEL